jgi:pilus assembly protein CpaC
VKNFSVQTNSTSTKCGFIALVLMAASLTTAGTGLAQSAPMVVGRGGFANSPAVGGAPKTSASAAPAPAAAGTAATPAGPSKAQTAAIQPSVIQVRPILIPRPIDTDHAPEVGGNFQSEITNEQATHITVGRSIFIDTRHRLARVYITDPDVIDSYTASPNQVVVTAKKPGATTLILWDETGEAKSYLVSADLNVEMLRDSMKQALPGQSIKVVGNEGRVVLTGTVENKDVADAAVKIAGIYSKDVSNSLLVNTSRGKQVRLEVKVVEADRTKLAQFGFNFFSSGGQNPGGTTTGQFPSTLGTTIQNGTKTVNVTNPLNLFLYVNKFNIGATIQDLETMQVLQILAEPNITAMSGEKASFLAGGEFPFPIVQSSSTGAPVVTLMFKSYGVKLDFTPFVNDDGTIDLKVSPEVSALDYTNAVTISGYTIPAISSRRADTEVVLKNGQTFAISGLLDKRTTDLYSKTPGASSIPILGQLFKSKATNHTDTELIVIITPTIVDPISMESGAPQTLAPLPSQPLTPPPALPPANRFANPMQKVPTLDPAAFDTELPKGATKP